MRIGFYVSILVLLCSTQTATAGQVHIESANGNIEGVRALVGRDRTAAVSITAEERLTPLHLAAQNGHLEIVRLLLSHGSPVDPLDRNLATPLFRASLRGQYECVAALVEAGADVNLAADGKIRSLHVAAMNGHYQVVELLLKSGADSNARDVEGADPYDFALSREIQELLVTHRKQVRLPAR